MWRFGGSVSGGFVGLDTLGPRFGGFGLGAPL